MKYVFFDIDGTIRGKSREITKRNREAICKLRENGHKAFLCTGRAPVSITQDILDVGFDGVISFFKETCKFWIGLCIFDLSSFHIFSSIT